MGIYGALRVPEIWRFDGRILQVLLRQQDGSYRESPTERGFPAVPMHEIARFATMEGIRDVNRPEIGSAACSANPWTVRANLENR